MRKLCGYVKSNGSQCLEIIKDKSADYCPEHNEPFGRNKKTTAEDSEALQRVYIERYRQEFNLLALQCLERIGLTETIACICDTSKIVSATFIKRKLNYNI